MSARNKDTSRLDVDEELLAKLDATADGNDWAPEPGDVVIGDLAAVEHPRTKDGRYLPVLTLNTGEGPVRVAVKHTVLARELVAARVQPGDRVAVRFNGRPEGKAYFHYSVAVQESGPRDPDSAFRPEPAEDLTDEALDATGDTQVSAWG